MQSPQHPNPQPLPSLPSIPSKSPSHLHKTHLSIHYLSFTQEIHIPQENVNIAITVLQVHQKLRIPQGVKSLSLDLEKISLPRNKAIKIILNSLKQFRSIETLKIDCISFKNSPIIMKALRNFRNLKRLEIIFTRIASPFYAGDYVQDLITSLYKSCPRLAELKLAFQDGPSALAQDDYRSYLKNWRISRLNNLQKLTFHLPISTFLQFKRNRKEIIDPEHYLDLSPIKRFYKLRALDIALIHRLSDKYTKINPHELHFDPNKLFPNVKKFTWSVFSSQPFKIKEFDLIGPQIALKLQRLEDFGLGFKQKEARVGVEIKELSQCLATLQTDLNHLSFAHSCGELSGQDAEALISALSLPRVKILGTLSLEFRSCKGINNGFLADLVQGIAQNLTGMRSLRLCFESQKEGQRSIFEVVKTIIGYEGISDRGVKKFASHLSKGCLQLESLSLEFRKYSEISDKGVESLFERLDRLKSLKKVWIRFQDCEDVTEIGCQEAVKKLGGVDRKVFFSCA